ncbi:MAG: hypothetical protein HQM08_04175 [Candidatus Riflebacteria bacterium]|nr:hypothetical protein [Candidatus Riflebacteria bacterium]
MKKWCLLIVTLFFAVSLVAQEPTASPQDNNASGTQTQPSQGKGHWLDGVDIPPTPPFPAPQFSVQISLPDGSPVPATLTEDMGVVFSAQSDIFGDNPPTEYQGNPLTNAQWAGVTSINWYFDDVTKNKSTHASATEGLPPNQIQVIPLDPTVAGAVSVFLSRPLRYEESPGQYRRIYATASKSAPTRVIDITPPCPGMEITLDNGISGQIWSVEEPPNKFPLPKTANVIYKGALFSKDGQDVNKNVIDIPLGQKMVLPETDATAFIPAKTKVTVKSISTDNDQIDDKTLKIGICELDSVPQIISDHITENYEAQKFTALKKPGLFLEIADKTGNKSCIFVRVMLK